MYFDCSTLSEEFQAWRRFSQIDHISLYISRAPVKLHRRKRKNGCIVPERNILIDGPCSCKDAGALESVVHLCN